MGFVSVSSISCVFFKSGPKDTSFRDLLVFSAAIASLASHCEEDKLKGSSCATITDCSVVEFLISAVRTLLVCSLTEFNSVVSLQSRFSINK